MLGGQEAFGMLRRQVLYVGLPYVRYERLIA